MIVARKKVLSIWCRSGWRWYNLRLIKAKKMCRDNDSAHGHRLATFRDSEGLFKGNEVDFSSINEGKLSMAIGLPVIEERKEEKTVSHIILRYSAIFGFVVRFGTVRFGYGRNHVTFSRKEKKCVKLDSAPFTKAWQEGIVFGGSRRNRIPRAIGTWSDWSWTLFSEEEDSSGQAVVLPLQGGPLH